MDVFERFVDYLIKSPLPVLNYSDIGSTISICMASVLAAVSITSYENSENKNIKKLEENRKDIQDGFIT